MVRVRALIRRTPVRGEEVRDDEATLQSYTAERREGMRRTISRRPAGRQVGSENRDGAPMRRYRIGGAKFPQAMIVDMLSGAACTFTEYSTDADSGWLRFTWALAVPLLATLSGVYASAVPRICPMLPHRPTCTSHGWMPPGGAFEIETDTSV